MKTQPKKLRASKETLRRLTHELGVVAGGTIVVIQNSRCCAGDTCAFAPAR